MIYPARFIPLAEENSLIVEMGAWAIREACAQTARWREIEGCEELGVSINLSMRQLQDESLAETLDRALTDSGLPAGDLVMEITESMLALDVERTAESLADLKALGVNLAIDDFGTGYSSLSYLRTFPIDAIKIDKTFIHELEAGWKSAPLVKTIVNLAEALGTYTVAEGIEIQQHADMLSELGCDRGQGFHYCRPLVSGALEERLRDLAAAPANGLDSWARVSEEVKRQPYELEFRRGVEEIEVFGQEIHELAAELALPVTSRWRWLQRWCEVNSGVTRCFIGARSRENGRLVGCAMLATRVENGVTEAFTMGPVVNGATFLGVSSDEAAGFIAAAIAAEVTGMASAWSLRLEHVDRSNPILRQLEGGWMFCRRPALKHRNGQRRRCGLVDGSRSLVSSRQRTFRPSP
ncbi:MAG: EAL domain-containing protein (putative c-di-GMP-specific phosphodiesterase class I) [Acidimicrobiales bacterium]